MTEEVNLEAPEKEIKKTKTAENDLTDELGVKNQRIVELEQSLVDRNTEVDTLKQNLAELETRFNEVNGTLSRAITGYRAMAIKANPEMPAELIAGDTIEAIDKAVVNARELVGKVKEKLVNADTQVRVPAGAPPRMPPDFSALSSREKIQQGIAKRS